VGDYVAADDKWGVYASAGGWLECHADGVPAGGERMRAGHRRALDAREVVRVVEVSAVQVEAEAPEPTALRDQHALGAAGSDLDIGDDPVRTHLEVRRQILGPGRRARVQRDALARPHGMTRSAVEHDARRQ